MLAACWPAVLRAAQPLPATSSFQHHLVQGRFLLEEGRPGQALSEFEVAAQMDEGAGNAELQYLLAHSYYATDRIEQAVPAIRRARAIAVPQGAFSAEIADLHDFLVASFAEVTVIGAGPEARLPEPVVPLIDPKLKRIFERTIEFLRAPVHRGSFEIYLPVGAYRLGGHIVELGPDREARLDLRATTGRTASGVYGEGRSSGPPGGLGSLMLQLGASGYYQQGEGGGGGRLQVGWLCRFLEGRLGVRFGLEAALTRLERLQREDGVATPLGPSVSIQLGVAPVFDLGPRVLLSPWFTWSVGYGHPIESALPQGYLGPVHYLVHGPDLEVLFGFPPRRQAPGRRTLSVEPVVGLRVLFREAIPLGLEEFEDRRPHVTVGGGVEFGLRIGG
jgi:hypothetical protein